jgi:predicted glycogen debranching enzyme
MDNPATFLNFGSDICADLESADSREWLVTNGIGGFASGTISGILTRRYHGLLIAACKPPLDRKLLLTKLEETATYHGEKFELFANRWADGSINPTGFKHIQQFRLEGAIPVWTFAFADALLEKRIWMQPGENTTYVRYSLIRGLYPVSLDIKVLVNYRDYYGETHGGAPLHVELIEQGIKVLASEDAVPYYVCSAGVEALLRSDWYRDFSLSQEQYRGFAGLEDHFLAAEFHGSLSPGGVLAVLASTAADANLGSEIALVERRKYESDVVSHADRSLDNAPLSVRQLLFAADQFIVCRERGGEKDGHSMLAGYQWFGDWGRDTMISLPGLTLTTGRQEIARSILRTFARYIDKGMLPNRFPDAGEVPEYNTVDATLWYFDAIHAYHAATGDDALLKELFPALQEIIDWHLRGTRYHIGVDHADGLLFAGEPGVQLTWMDAKVDDWVVTPRIGKPVEINALWYHALSLMASFAERLGQSSQTYTEAAKKVRLNFLRFWNEEAGYCFDVIDGPHGNDPSFRPNQLFTLSLPEGDEREPALLDASRQTAILDACALHLLTSYGLRSLGPSDPAYMGHYGGSRQERDRAYHQGTVWGWLIGPFISAHLKVYKDAETARSFLTPLLDNLSAHGLGTVSEIFDGDPPFAPRGCIAQAWSVGAILRTWQQISES